MRRSQIDIYINLLTYRPKEPQPRLMGRQHKKNKMKPSNIRKTEDEATESLTHDPEQHEMIHRDISIGNQYRQEGIKHSMTLATGVFVFTATFYEKFTKPVSQIPNAFPVIIALGWLCLVCSLLSGLLHMYGWERFYLSYRHDHRDEATRLAAKLKRDRLLEQIDFYRHVQGGGLVIGLLLIGLYVICSI